MRLRGSLPLEKTAEILQQASRGLNAAHKLGIIHRDLKPDNILLTYDDEGQLLLKIVDFGIAKMRESTTHTITGLAFGTPAYMSVEQASGMRSEELDGRSDVYSLGIVVYEMITGRVPFHAETPLGQVRKHLIEPPPPFGVSREDLQIAPQIEQVVMKALSKPRESRYPTAPDFARDFANAIAAGETPQRPSALQAGRKQRPTVNGGLRQSAPAWRTGHSGSDALSEVLRPPRLWRLSAVNLTFALAVLLAVGTSAWLALRAPFTKQRNENFKAAVSGSPTYPTQVPTGARSRIPDVAKSDGGATRQLGDVQNQSTRVRQKTLSTSDEASADSHRVKGQKASTAKEQPAQQRVVGAVKQEVAGTQIASISTTSGTFNVDVQPSKLELERTIANLKRATGELDDHASLIATNARELQALRLLGEHNYIGFKLAKSKQPMLCGEVMLELRETDPERNTFTIVISVNDKSVVKQDRRLNEPIQFYTEKYRQPDEVVVNQILRNAIVGYLAVPNGQKQMLASKQPKQQPLASAAKQETESVGTQIASIPTDSGTAKVDAQKAKTELEQTIANLKRATGELNDHASLIATNARELQALRLLGEHDYIEFKLAKSKKPMPCGEIMLELRKTDLERNTFTIVISADDTSVVKKDRKLNEPIQVYTKEYRQPDEIVINQILKDAIIGYLATPRQRMN